MNPNTERPPGAHVTFPEVAWPEQPATFLLPEGAKLGSVQISHGGAWMTPNEAALADVGYEAGPAAALHKAEPIGLAECGRCWGGCVGHVGAQPDEEPEPRLGADWLALLLTWTPHVFWVGVLLWVSWLLLKAHGVGL